MRQILMAVILFCTLPALAVQITNSRINCNVIGHEAEDLSKATLDKAERVLISENSGPTESEALSCDGRFTGPRIAIFAYLFGGEVRELTHCEHAFGSLVLASLYGPLGQVTTWYRNDFDSPEEALMLSRISTTGEIRGTLESYWNTTEHLELDCQFQ